MPGFAILAAWLAMIALAGPVGGLLARQAARPAAVSPLGLTRRRPRPLTRTSALVPLVSVLVMAIAFFPDGPYLAVNVPLVLVAALALALSIGPWIILLTGRLTASSQDLVTSMAGRRLLADVRTPGRVVGVLLSVGLAFGVIAVLVAEVFQEQYGDVRGFYLSGAGAAALAAAVAAVVATFSLTVGASEQILDSPRSTAILVALAASPRFVSSIVRRQMLLVAVPPAMVGALVGWAVYGWITTGADSDEAAVLLALPVSVVAAALASGAGALVATRAVWPAILSTSGPENLRTP